MPAAGRILLRRDFYFLQVFLFLQFGVIINVLSAVTAERGYYMYKNIEKQQKLQLKDLVDYMPGQVISKTLVQNDKVSMTVFSFDKGEEISTHAAGGDAMVTVLEGTGKFTVGGEEFILNEGETLIMPKDIPHAVFGEQRFKMQLTVSF